MKTKIFYIITKANWGGAQRYVYDLATSLPKDRFDVTVICGEGKALQEKLENAGIRVISLPQLNRDVHLSKDISALFTLIKIFRAERPDIVHLNSSKIGGLGGFAARWSGVKKIIFTGHGWAFNEHRPAFQKFSISFLHWVTIALSHTTISVSEKTKKDILRLPFISNKVRVIHNGNATISFLPKEAARQEIIHKTTKDVVWIGTISELHKNKGLDYMIEALAALEQNVADIPEYIFTIIGEGEERKALTQLIEEKKLSNKIFLVGRIDDAARLLKAFDIATLTSRTEALPYFILEAGQARLPVIASAVGGIPEIIGQMKSGILIQPGNIKDLRDAIALLLKDSEKRPQLGHALHDLVTTEFSLDKMLAETIRVYDQK